MPRRQPLIGVARAYGLGEPGGEYRVLVDRLWPRGISKAKLRPDAWLKDLAPSTLLRKWFGHRSDRWDEFRERYTEELKEKAVDLADLRKIAAKQRVVLVYGARDDEHNHAIVLRDVLRQGRDVERTGTEKVT